MKAKKGPGRPKLDTPPREWGVWRVSKEQMDKMDTLSEQYCSDEPYTLNRGQFFSVLLNCWEWHHKNEK